MIPYNFNSGDEVEYVGTLDDYKGNKYTLKEVGNHTATVIEADGFRPFLVNLKLVEPPKEYIKIDRALLPEVTVDEVMPGILRVGVDSFHIQTSEQATDFAYKYLAMAEHLKVKEAKVNELDERRNAILKEHGFRISYEDAVTGVRSMVNALIAAEDSK